MPRIHASQPEMLSEFEEKFKKILKRIYRTLQQHEIREEVKILIKNRSIIKIHENDNLSHL